MAPADSRPSRIVRIGQIVPSSNTTMETEIPAMLRAREQHFPERFTFHSSRMRMKRVSPEEPAAMNQEGLRCAAELADARVDVMSTACLVAIMAQGPGYHRQGEEEFKRVAAAGGARCPPAPKGDDLGRRPDPRAEKARRKENLAPRALHQAAHGEGRG